MKILKLHSLFICHVFTHLNKANNECGYTASSGLLSVVIEILTTNISVFIDKSLHFHLNTATGRLIKPE